MYFGLDLTLGFGKSFFSIVTIFVEMSTFSLFTLVLFDLSSLLLSLLVDFKVSLSANSKNWFVSDLGINSKSEDNESPL